MTLYEGKEGVTLYQAITLKHAMKLSMLGIQPGRGWTRKAMIVLARKITGNDYRVGVKGFEAAFDDICKWVESKRGDQQS